MMYQEELQELKKQGIVGAVLGFVLALILVIDSGSFAFAPFILFPLAFAGAVYGWKLFGRLLYSFVVGSVPVMVIGFLLRGIASLMIGWFLYPIVLLYTYWKAKKEG